MDSVMHLIITTLVPFLYGAGLYQISRYVYQKSKDIGLVIGINLTGGCLMIFILVGYVING